MILVDSFGIGLHGVNQVSLRQAVTPERLRGRMTATIRFLNIGTMPLGMLLGGALGSFVGLRPAIWICAAGLFLAALRYGLSSTRRLIELPAPSDEPTRPGSPTDVPSWVARLLGGRGRLFRRRVVLDLRRQIARVGRRVQRRLGRNVLRLERRGRVG